MARDCQNHTSKCLAMKPLSVHSWLPQHFRGGTVGLPEPQGLQPYILQVRTVPNWQMTANRTFVNRSRWKLHNHLCNLKEHLCHEDIQLVCLQNLKSTRLQETDVLLLFFYCSFLAYLLHIKDTLMVVYMQQIPKYLFFVCVFTPVLLTERGLSSLHFF